MLLRHPSSRTSDYQVPRLRSALHLLPRPPLVLPIRPSPGVLELHSRQSHVLRVAPAVAGAVLSLGGSARDMARGGRKLLAGVRGAAEGAGVLGVELIVVFGLVSKGYGVCSVWVHGW